MCSTCLNRTTLPLKGEPTGENNPEASEKPYIVCTVNLSFTNLNRVYQTHVTQEDGRGLRWTKEQLTSDTIQKKSSKKNVFLLLCKNMLRQLIIAALKKRRRTSKGSENNKEFLTDGLNNNLAWIRLGCWLGLKKRTYLHKWRKNLEEQNLGGMESTSQSFFIYIYEFLQQRSETIGRRD